ncbi:MAG TPA: carboxypeptidase-like regulatory domain-containing protein [Bryobacteraceae bacterium]|nr:carboxypeptidase-like regulatory domain-containing protein [Bryobacteraceae bacterium]
MRKLLLALCAFQAAAQVNGVVVNQTTGQPQPNATVTLTRMGGDGGLQPAGETRTGPDGKFSFAEPLQGPTLIRAAYNSVTYSRMLPPGTPGTNLTLDVYESSKNAGNAKVSKHMILFEPAGSEMSVNETFIYANEGKTTWADPANGTLKFYLPPGASKLQVNGTAPGGMPIAAATSKAGQPNVYKADFPVKPGETRFDLTYAFPYKTGDQYEGKVVTQDENTYLIVPSGVTLKAENVRDMGVEPRTQAHIFALDRNSYNIQLTGAEIAPPGETQPQQEQDSGPQITPILPRIYTQTKLILPLAFGILALGFVMLYRKEAHGRS